MSFPQNRLVVTNEILFKFFCLKTVILLLSTHNNQQKKQKKQKRTQTGNE